MANDLETYAGKLEPTSCILLGLSHVYMGLYPVREHTIPLANTHLMC